MTDSRSPKKLPARIWVLDLSDSSPEQEPQHHTGSCITTSYHSPKPPRIFWEHVCNSPSCFLLVYSRLTFRSKVVLSEQVALFYAWQLGIVNGLSSPSRQDAPERHFAEQNNTAIIIFILEALSRLQVISTLPW